MTMRKLILIVLASFIAYALPVMARSVEMPVYQSWRGNSSEYKSARPFFLITDLYDLERFWEKANLDEGMPNIDFAKLMLFVWNPGSSMFDHRPVQVERFLSKDGNYLLLMDFNRKNTGGYWRRPVVATLLPKVDRGDIQVMARHRKNSVHYEWRHIYTIWDMKGDRKRPFEVVALDKPAPRQEFISHEGGQDVTEEGRVALASRPAEKSSAVAVSQPGTSRPVSQPSFSTGQRAAAQPATQAARAAPAEMPDATFDDIFGSSSSSASEKKAPSTPEPKAKKTDTPGFEEDPLFGTEFDITF